MNASISIVTAQRGRAGGPTSQMGGCAAPIFDTVLANRVCCGIGGVCLLHLLGTPHCCCQRRIARAAEPDHARVRTVMADDAAPWACKVHDHTNDKLLGSGSSQAAALRSSCTRAIRPVYLIWCFSWSQRRPGHCTACARGRRWPARRPAARSLRASCRRRRSPRSVGRASGSAA